MLTRPRRSILTALCTLACLGAVPAGAGAVVIGIGDANPAMFRDPRFLALHVTTARYIVPWDLVSNRANARYLPGFQTWLAGAEADHVAPLISFGADYTNPAANYIPTVAQYSHAVQAFLKAFPKIKLYTAWNEPDFSYRKLAREPALAAAYFNTLYGVCHGCTVLAGDVYLATSGPLHVAGSVAQLGPWLRAYIRGLRHRPAGWALHDYTEIRGHSTSQLRTLMSLTSGPIWLDETGGVLRRGHWSYRNQSAAAAASDEKFLLSLTKRYPRIARIYHYEWQGTTSAGWDSGLIAPDGSTRPAYQVLKDWINPPRKRLLRRTTRRGGASSGGTSAG